MLISLVLLAGLGAQEEAPSPDAIRTAVERALVPIQKSGRVYQDERSCFSCHHQAVPILALALAKDRGIAIDEEAYRMQVDFTYDFLKQAKKAYLKGRGQGGKASTAGYALLALEAADRKRDDVTEAVAGFLVGMNEDQGYWKLTSRRPPSGASRFSTAALSVRAMRKWGVAKEKERIDARVVKVRTWLLETDPEDTEDRVFRLQGLKAAGADPKDVRAATEDLLRRQLKDGGWAQKEDMKSDAYATGSVLLALHQSGGIPVDHPAYRRGLAYLLATQKEDGTWYVKTRAKGFQKYFESGFPYGKNQFISITASSWAVAALSLGASPPAKDSR